MSKNTVVEIVGREHIRDELTDLIREGACKLIAQGLELEVSELLSRMTGRQDELGRAAVVRNGYQPTRDIQTGIGPVTVKVPKIRSRDGKAVSFHSALVPPYVRKTATLEAALPWLYLKGISTGEMQPALECKSAIKFDPVSAPIRHVSRCFYMFGRVNSRRRFTFDSTEWCRDPLPSLRISLSD